MKTFLVLLAILIVVCADAQLPETDIYTSRVFVKNGALVFSTPVNITNRKGYDNHPCFTGDGKQLLFVSSLGTNQNRCLPL